MNRDQTAHQLEKGKCGHDFPSLHGRFHSPGGRHLLCSDAAGTAATSDPVAAASAAATSDPGPAATTDTEPRRTRRKESIQVDAAVFEAIIWRDSGAACTCPSPLLAAPACFAESSVELRDLLYRRKFRHDTAPPVPVPVPVPVSVSVVVTVFCRHLHLVGTSAPRSATAVVDVGVGPRSGVKQGIVRGVDGAAWGGHGGDLVTGTAHV